MSGTPQEDRKTAEAPDGAKPRRLVCGSFEEAMDAFESPLLRYVLHVMRCSHEDAEDIVQEAFLRLHRQWTGKGRETVSDLSGWLFKVTHNLVLDGLRKTQRQRKAGEKMIETAMKQVSEGDAIGDLEHREACHRAMAAVEELPDEQRQLLLMKIVSGMSLRQIGSVTGMTVGNAGYHVQRALEKVARQLKKESVI